MNPELAAVSAENVEVYLATNDEIWKFGIHTWNHRLRISKELSRTTKLSTTKYGADFYILNI